MHEEYRTMMQSMVGGKPPVAKKAKGPPRPKLPVDMELMTQANAKMFFPPSCLLWKTRATSTWNIQVKGWPESKSRSCKTRGESMALRLLATESWYEWSVLEGVDFADVPIDGLMLLHQIKEASEKS